MCNLAGAAFGAYPSTGSFARSAVASSAGAKTGAHGIVNAAAVGLVLAFLTPVFQHMPLNALAAIVITGVLGLLDFGRVVTLFRVGFAPLLRPHVFRVRGQLLLPYPDP